MKKIFTTLALVVVVPVLAFAHSGYHPQPHPNSSPNYHEVGTDGYPVEAAVSISGGSATTEVAEETLIQILIQLIMQHLSALGLVGSFEDLLAESEEEEDSSDESSDESIASEEADIVAGVGNLDIRVTDTYRYFESNSLPTYTITGGRFAHEEEAQEIDFKAPRFPEMNAKPEYYELPWTFGIAINGVVFEPFAAEWYQDDRNSGWQEDPFVTLRGFDASNAHVQPNGLYHYHGLPEQLMSGHDESEHSPVIGYAGDGFPVYYLYVYEDENDVASDIIAAESSWQLKDGDRDNEDPSGPGGDHDGTYNEDYEYVAGSGDLDECNGRYGPTAEYPEGTYYYVLTEEYPYVPRCLMGDQDPSFKTTPF